MSVEHQWDSIDRKIEIPGENLVTLSSINLMCTVLELNVGLCFEKLANSKLHLKNISYLEYAVAPHQLTC
jgi:hypothetical protein